MPNFQSWRLKGLEELLEESISRHNKEISDSNQNADEDRNVEGEIRGSDESSIITLSRESRPSDIEKNNLQPDTEPEKTTSSIEVLEKDVSEKRNEDVVKGIQNDVPEFKQANDYSDILNNARISKVVSVKVNLKTGDLQEYIFNEEEANAESSLLSYLLGNGKIISINKDSLPKIYPLLNFLKNFGHIISFFVRRDDFDSITLDRLRTIGAVSYE